VLGALEHVGAHVDVAADADLCLGFLGEELVVAAMDLVARHAGELLGLMDAAVPQSEPLALGVAAQARGRSGFDVNLGRVADGGGGRITGADVGGACAVARLAGSARETVGTGLGMYVAGKLVDDGVVALDALLAAGRLACVNGKCKCADGKQASGQCG